MTPTINQASADAVITHQKVVVTRVTTITVAVLVTSPVVGATGTNGTSATEIAVGEIAKSAVGVLKGPVGVIQNSSAVTSVTVASQALPAHIGGL